MRIFLCEKTSRNLFELFLLLHSPSQICAYLHKLFRNWIFFMFFFRITGLRKNLISTLDSLLDSLKSRLFMILKVGKVLSIKNRLLIRNHEESYEIIFPIAVLFSWLLWCQWKSYFSFLFSSLPFVMNCEQ